MADGVKIEGYWWGYDGEFLTKEEWEKKTAEAVAEQERDRLWLLENPDFEYGW